MAAGISTIGMPDLVEEVRAKLESEPHEQRWSETSVEPVRTPDAAFTLIVGAGFSHGIVPVVRELMYESIGGYYYYDQDQAADGRAKDDLQKLSADFWNEYNEAAAKLGETGVVVDDRGLPENPGAAYQHLFANTCANALFAIESRRDPTFLQRMKEQRGQDPEVDQQGEDEQQGTGERFVLGFLRYLMDPGCEGGWGSTGRCRLNEAHIYLASLLEAQQRGLMKTLPFCRTIFTTNFDTLLQNALQMVNLMYRLTDRPETGLDWSDFAGEEAAIHLVYTHGSILRHNPASTSTGLEALSTKNKEVLRRYLESRDVIAIGYSGWNDTLMGALQSCDSTKHRVYWCGLKEEPIPAHVVRFLSGRADSTTYVALEREQGAGGLMRALYETLTPSNAKRDVWRRYRDWSDLVWDR